MAYSVRNGYATIAYCAHRRCSTGYSARAHQIAQPMWRLGIAAHWLEMASMVPLSKDQNPPISDSESRNSYWLSLAP